jgi:hypothetical protein
LRSAQVGCEREPVGTRAYDRNIDDFAGQDRSVELNRFDLLMDSSLVTDSAAKQRRRRILKQLAMRRKIVNREMGRKWEIHQSYGKSS